MNVVFILFFSFFSRAETTCFGPKDPKFSVTYLHGMDWPNPGELELANRATLNRIANALKIGIALPRAKDPCPSFPQQNCWGAGTSYDQLARSTLKLASDEAHSCFPKARPLTVIGFSNGGYMVNRGLLLCLKTEFKYFVTSGSGGVASDTNSLANCGDFTMVGGKNDGTITSIREFFHQLQSLNAHATLIEFEGGHYLPESELQSLLAKQIEATAVKGQ